MIVVFGLMCLALTQDLSNITNQAHIQPIAIQVKQSQKEAQSAKSTPTQEHNTTGALGSIEEQERETRSNETNSYNPRQDTLYRWYLRATIVGVIGGLIGLSILIWQSILLRSNTKATQRSVKLQENTQRQWVNLEDFHAYRISPDLPLEVSFKIVNPTSLPITLHAVITKIDGKDAEMEGLVTLLTPSNPFMESVGVALDKGQRILLERNALSLDIECTVLFADSHGIHWRQEFGRKFYCGRDNPVVTDTKNALHESGIPGKRGSRDTELPT